MFSSKLTTCLRSFIVAAFFFSASAFAVPSPNYWSYWDISNEGSHASVDHSDLDLILRTYVVTNHPSGINRFKYGQVSSKHRRLLEDYIAELSALDPRRYRRAEQKVYWMNLYNALTINLVLDHYPIASIREITGRAGRDAWKEQIVEVAGKRLSLNDIDHRILRPIWHDHKVRFGLACASLGCPNMQPVAFTTANNRKLLKKAGRDFVNHSRGLKMENGELRVSSIFDWYEKDFAADKKTLLKVFAHYAEDRKALYLLGFSGDITYAYDWRINAP